MSNIATFTPLMRQTVGFDRFHDLFESLLGETEDRFEAYPPYNIEKNEDNGYLITIAVAGFDEDDISIIVQDDRLKVTASRKGKDHDIKRSYLHRGIATRDFERSFRLEDHIRVIDASLSHGLLLISLVREVPEEKKPRIISINKTPQKGTTKAGLLSKKKT